MTKSSLATSRIERWYNKIVIGFVALTVILIALIAYFSFSKTTITVQSAEMVQELALQVPASELDGTVLITEVTGSHSVTEFDSVEAVPGTASGTVTIVNNYNQNQPLVATTRLLSEDGVLFRTQETVNVPAGGSVEVAVAADEEGAQGNIEATTFEIVALWDGLKDRIYATSDTAMTGGLVSNAVVSANDIANATAAASTQLQAEAVTLFEQDVESREGLPTAMYLVDTPFQLETASENVSAAVGDTVNQLDVTVTASMASAVVDRELLSAYIENAMQEAVPTGMQLAQNQKIDDISVAVESVSEDQTDATLAIRFDTSVTLSAESELLNTRQLTNKTEGEAKAYLTAFDEIDEATVRFSPFWVKRTPSIADNITFVVE